MEQYDRVKLLGKGSFGKVFLMRHKAQRNLLCMKVISVKNMQQKEQDACRIEVDILKSLNHPNIVGYIDSFLTSRGGYLCIAMEYCDGGDLDELIKGAKNRLFSERKILSYFVQMALGLHYMHSNRVLHRDLKTQNVFLLGNGRVVLGDLGISKVLDGHTDFASTCIGTPYYMSPEIFKNKPYNQKSDVWALGCVLYELTTLHHAFDASSLNGLSSKIIKGRYDPIDSKYSNSLKNLIASMLKVSTTSRPDMTTILSQEFIQKHIQNFMMDIVNRKQTLGEGTAAIKKAAVNVIKEYNGVDKLQVEENPDVRALQDQMRQLNLNWILSKAMEAPVCESSFKQQSPYAVKEQRGALKREKDRKHAVEAALARLRHEREQKIIRKHAPYIKQNVLHEKLNAKPGSCLQENIFKNNCPIRLQPRRPPDLNYEEIETLSHVEVQPSKSFEKINNFGGFVLRPNIAWSAPSDKLPKKPQKSQKSVPSNPKNIEGKYGNECKQSDISKPMCWIDKNNIIQKNCSEPAEVNLNYLEGREYVAVCHRQAKDSDSICAKTEIKNDGRTSDRYKEKELFYVKRTMSRNNDSPKGSKIFSKKESPIKKPSKNEKNFVHKSIFSTENDKKYNVKGAHYDYESSADFELMSWSEAIEEVQDIREENLLLELKMSAMRCNELKQSIQHDSYLEPNSSCDSYLSSSESSKKSTISNQFRQAKQQIDSHIKRTGKSISPPSNEVEALPVSSPDKSNKSMKVIHERLVDEQVNVEVLKMDGYAANISIQDDSLPLSSEYFPKSELNQDIPVKEQISSRIELADKTVLPVVYNVGQLQIEELPVNVVSKNDSSPIDIAMEATDISLKICETPVVTDKSSNEIIKNSMKSHNFNMNCILLSNNQKDICMIGKLADRIRTLRNMCVEGLGEELFKRAYSFIKEFDAGNQDDISCARSSENFVSGLQDIIGEQNMFYYATLDQLIFIEDSYSFA